MGPIEGLWGSIIAVFIFVGLARGFLKELGVTTVLIVMLFGLDRIIPFLEGFINKGGLLALGIKALPDSVTANCLNQVNGVLTPIPGPLNASNTVASSTEALLWLVFTLIVVVIAFSSYAGETLSYSGNNPKFPVGTLLGLLVGTVNGYLITGTLWWILNRYHYPVQQISLINPEQMSPLAHQIFDGHLLPLDLLGNYGCAPASGFGAIWLPLILVVLIILKVLR